MADEHYVDPVPGMVQVKYVGPTNKETGDTKGHIRNVFPIDAKDLVATGSYKLVENGMIEAAKLNPGPLRSYVADGMRVIEPDTLDKADGAVLLNPNEPAPEAKAKDEQAKVEAKDDGKAKPAATKPN